MVARTTSYQRAVKGMSPAEVRELDDLFGDIADLGAPWHLVGPNIQEKEHFLPSPTMRRLLAELKALIKNPADMATGYEEFCRTHKLRGRRVEKRHVGPVLGYVKDLQTFCIFLRRTNPLLFRGPHDTRVFVRKLLNSEPLTTNERTVLLGEFQTWCTWSLDKDDPFSFAVTGFANEFRATLGLPPNPHEQLLVFRYNRREVGDLFRPTVCDAELHEYFEPSRLSDRRFGKTKTWKMADLDEHIRAAMAAVKLKRQPEGIHRPLTAAQMNPTELL